MVEIKKFPIKFNQVEFIFKRKNKLFLKSFYTKNNQIILTGQDGYFNDLAAGLYRNRPGISDAARAWKFILKYFFFTKGIFSKIEKSQDQRKEIFILDIGCSKGYFRKILESNIREGEKIIYFGVDLRKDILRKAIFDNSIDSGARDNKITSVYIWHDATKKFPLKSKAFDFIICSQVIKYLGKEGTNYLISEIYRLLKKNGILFLSNGLMFNNKVNLKMVREKKKRGEYYWTTKELLKIFRKNKFKKIKIYGGETTIKILIKNLKTNEKKLINKFRKIFPDEIVESILGFFYPHLSGVKTFFVKKR